MLTDVDSSMLSVLWRSVLAALIGLAIGWERRAQQRAKDAVKEQS